MILEALLQQLHELLHDQSFLEVFSTTVANADRKKQIDQTGFPECDTIRCPSWSQWYHRFITSQGAINLW